MKHHVTILHPRRNDDGRALVEHDVTLGKRHPTISDVAARYEIAWEGEIALEDVADDPESPVHDQHGIEHFLELLWSHVERGGPDCAIPRVVTEDDPIRSFQVGDLVEINDEVWVCDSIGWSRLEPGAAKEIA